MRVKWLVLAAAAYMLFGFLSNLAESAEIAWEPSLTYTHNSSAFCCGPLSLHPDRDELTHDAIQLCATFWRRGGPRRFEVDLCEGVRAWDGKWGDVEENTALTVRWFFMRGRR